MNNEMNNELIKDLKVIKPSDGLNNDIDFAYISATRDSEYKDASINKDTDEIKELDKQFETINLINCKEVDVFIKVLSLVDVKNANNIRGELNHVVKKYIDTIPGLKDKLLNEDYDNYNLDYIKGTFVTMAEYKTHKYYEILKDTIAETMNKIGTYNFRKTTQDYFERVCFLEDPPELDKRKYVKECDPGNNAYLQIIHDTLSAIFLLKNKHYAPTDYIQLKSMSIVSDPDPSGIEMIFNCVSENGAIRTVIFVIPCNKLSNEIIKIMKEK